MGRRRLWPFILIILMLSALSTIQYLTLIWLIPRYAVHAIRNALGQEISIGAARMEFPFTLELSDVRWEGQWPKAGLLAKQVTIKPGWVSWKHKTVFLRSIEIQEGWLYLSRGPEGAVHWPSLEFAGDPEPPGTGFSGHWTVTVASLMINQSTVSYYDEQPRKPFNGAVEHVSVVAGSVSWPPVPSRVTLAVRGVLLGHGGHSAPLYCSGWFNSTQRDVDISCQLEPLAMAAFEPYYNQGRLTARMYDATIKATSQWSARNNNLDGRIQLTIANLNEADLSMRGTTIVDIQKIAQGKPPTLTGQIKIGGPLDSAQQWQWELVPGNEMVQRLLKPLVDRGREAIRVRLGGERIAVGISEATKAEMSGIKEASKQVEKALELLTEELPQEIKDLVGVEAQVKKAIEKTVEGETGIPVEFTQSEVSVSEQAKESPGLGTGEGQVQEQETQSPAEPSSAEGAKQQPVQPAVAVPNPIR